MRLFVVVTIAEERGRCLIQLWVEVFAHKMIEAFQVDSWVIVGFEQVLSWWTELALPCKRSVCLKRQHVIDFSGAVPNDVTVLVLFLQNCLVHFWIRWVTNEEECEIIVRVWLKMMRIEVETLIELLLRRSSMTFELLDAFQNSRVRTGSKPKLWHLSKLLSMAAASCNRTFGRGIRLQMELARQNHWETAFSVERKVQPEWVWKQEWSENLKNLARLIVSFGNVFGNFFTFRKSSVNQINF